MADTLVECAARDESVSTPDLGDGVAVRYAPAAERFQLAFEAVVEALRRHSEDKVKADVFFAVEAAEAEALKKAEREREEREATERKKREEEEAAAAANGDEGREASPSPAAPAAEEKKAPTASLFAALGSPSPASAAKDKAAAEPPAVVCEKEKARAALLADPHGPSLYKATASKAIVKAVKVLFEGCLVATDAPHAAPYAPWLANVLLADGRPPPPSTSEVEADATEEGLAVSSGAAASSSSQPPYAPPILEDHNVALYAICFANSSCLHARACADAGTPLDGDALLRLAMAVARAHRRQRKIIHVCFSGLVNMCHVPHLTPAPLSPKELIELVAPQHAEARVVEAWAMALTNVCLRFPALIKPLCEAGAVLTIERLLLLFGDDPRVLSRGLALLGVLTQHTVAVE